MTSERLWISVCGAILCLAHCCARAGPAEADYLVAIEPAVSSAASAAEFHETVRQSLRGRSYTLITAPSGIRLLMIETTPASPPSVFAPRPTGTDRARSLAAATDALGRAKGINILGDFPDATSHAIVTSALADPDARVREEAVDSLSQIDSVSAVASLQLVLRDPAERVRTAAISAIVENGAADLLRDNWGAMSSTDRLAAVDASGNVRSDAAFGFLRFAAAQDDVAAAHAAAAYLAER